MIATSQNLCCIPIHSVSKRFIGITRTLIAKTKLMTILSCLVFLGFFSLFTTSALAADDLLSGALDNIKANFGLNSVFIKVLYLMEIYYGWRKYRETHNPFAVGSIVLVAMALTYAIGKWVG